MENMSRKLTRKEIGNIHIKDELDDYIIKHTLRLHPAQEKLIKVTAEHPDGWFISHAQNMQLQQNLAKLIGVKKALEIGTYTGYGAMSIALVLPEDGHVIACDLNEEYANVGRPIWKEAGVDNKIDLRIGPAADTLQDLLNNGEAGTFDYAFIDADKPNYVTYYELALQLVRSGGLIIIDNTLWGSLVLLDDNEADVSTKGIKDLNKKIAADQRVRVSLVRMGDGITICFKE